MTDQQTPAQLTIPPTALDDAGQLLDPGQIPLGALIDPADILRFAQSVADLTQTACSVLLHDPQMPRPVLPDAQIQIVRAPIWRALSQVRAGESSQCETDLHHAAHAAMAAGKPVTADSIAGEGTLYACPIMLCTEGGWIPKAAIVAAAHDIYRFHYADRLAALMGRPVVETEELMCQTDKLCLNAAQLRRIRAIMDGQALSFSRQISTRYEELRSVANSIAKQRELAHAYELMDRECRLVGQIQRSLVPQQAPEIEGFAIATHYGTARRAGGDYYDFLSQSDGSWAFVIGDVSGHGADAAVAMAMMRAIVHTYRGPFAELDEVLTYTNRHLCGSILSDQFATALLGVLEAGGRRLSAASAGHHAPLLFDARAGQVRELKVATGPPLGMLHGAKYARSEAELNAGDILLLYTDGITDAFNPERRSFGKGNLAETLRSGAESGAEAVRDAVMERVQRFAAGRPPDDDQTLIVCEKL